MERDRLELVIPVCTETDGGAVHRRHVAPRRSSLYVLGLTRADPVRK